MGSRVWFSTSSRTTIVDTTQKRSKIKFFYFKSNVYNKNQMIDIVNGVYCKTNEHSFVKSESRKTFFKFTFYPNAPCVTFPDRIVVTQTVSRGGVLGLNPLPRNFLLFKPLYTFLNSSANHHISTQPPPQKYFSDYGLRSLLYNACKRDTAGELYCTRRAPIIGIKRYILLTNRFRTSFANFKQRSVADIIL